MRKAVWGAIALGVFAAHFGSPMREIPVLRSIASLAGLAGYLLLSFDPPVPGARQRQFMIAGVVASLASFLLAVSGSPFPLNILARFLAVAAIALPLWLVGGPAQFAFVAAATLAMFTGIPAVEGAGAYATSIHAYVAALAAFWVAGMIHNPVLLKPGETKRPRVVVASNIVTYSPQEKVDALARLERRYRDGELPEHVYWDKRQEIESR